MLYKIKKITSFLLVSSLLTASVSCSSTIDKAQNASFNESGTDAHTEPRSQNEEISSSAASTFPETTAAESQEKSTDLKGNIYDINGKLLVSEADDGTSKRIYSDDYAIPFANIVTEMSDGYDKAFDDILISVNPVGNNNIGQSIQLTLDADVQSAIYQYMENMNIIGSVVVMRTDGSIMAQISYPSYDPRTIADQSYDEELAWGECGNKAFQNYEPGSCFKIMSEVIADKHQIYSLYDEGTWEFDGTEIVNWDHDTNFSYPIAERTLNSAFINSSNIFFAKAFDQIGSEQVLSDLETIFHFTTDIECDFGPIHNNIEIYCDDDLRRTAFGQSYVLTCPIYLAALGREAAFGDMVKPFVLKNIVDTNNFSSIISTGNQENEIIASIPENLRQNLLDGMNGVASNLGVSVPQGYTLYAKTGTAETWLGDFLYITGCVKNSNDTGSATYETYENYGNSGSYIIVLQVQNPEYHGFKFASESARLYQGIVDIAVGN